MKITILTLFPNLFTEFLATSMIGRAQKKALAEYEVVDLRQFGEGVHQVVDDRPFGGGPGMIFKPDILAKAIKQISNKDSHIILTSASGKKYNQAKAQEFSKKSHLVIICGHYEGVDQRFIDKYVDEEISIGDYVLTGGEIPAMVIVDSTVRLLPGVLNKEEAVIDESFTTNLLEYPQYTRPENFEGIKAPEVLISGNHQKVDDWRREKALEKTKKVRPDLLK